LSEANEGRLTGREAEITGASQTVAAEAVTHRLAQPDFRLAVPLRRTLARTQPTLFLDTVKQGFEAGLVRGRH
jgi:hypothetical protein